jgi:endonuclease/exonuclease/phosphatase family metal-dependent hydrolase
MRKALTVAAWAFAVGVAVWALLRITGWDGWFPAVQVLAFTPYALVSAAVGVLLLLKWYRGPAVIAGVSAVVLAICVLPRGFADRDPQPAGPRLRVASANLRIGGADAAKILERLRASGVDLLAVQEMTPSWLASFTGAGIDSVLPYHYVAPASLAEGSAIFSRYPMTDSGSHLMALGWFQQVYGIVHVPGAAPVRVESAHAASPYNREMVPYWETTLRREPSPDGILLGDFNATLDHRPLRALLDRGWRDAASAVGAGFIPTWGPFHGDPVPPIAIDHVLLSQGIGVRDFGAFTIPGSDHRMIVSTLTLPTPLKR